MAAGDKSQNDDLIMRVYGLMGKIMDISQHKPDAIFLTQLGIELEQINQEIDNNLEQYCEENKQMLIKAKSEFLFVAKMNKHMLDKMQVMKREVNLINPPHIINICKRIRLATERRETSSKEFIDLYNESLLMDKTNITEGAKGLFELLHMCVEKLI